MKVWEAKKDRPFQRQQRNSDAMLSLLPITTMSSPEAKETEDMRTAPKVLRGKEL